MSRIRIQRNSIITLAAFLIALCLPLMAAAEPAASAITPYVDDATIAVVRLNVAPLDLDAMAAWAKDLNKAMGMPQKDLNQSLDMARAQGGVANAWIGKFNKAGGKTIYAIVGMGSPPTVRLAVPLAGGADAKTLGDMLTPPKSEPAATQPGGPPGGGMFDQQVIPDAKAEVIGKTLYVASPQVMQTLKDFTPAARPELEAALAACGNATIAIAINPNEGLRGMAVMAMPQLPKEIGGGPVTILSQGLRWVCLTLDLPPKVSLHLTIQAKDAAAAGKLHGIVDSAFKMFKEQAAANAPGLDKYLDALTPAVAGDQLHLDVDDQKFLFLAKAVGPAIARARETATRVKSANNLRQLAMATLMYSNDHDGKLPVNAKEELKSYLGPDADTFWVNPMYPDHKEGYYYIRSAEKITAITAPSETPLFYESLGIWQNGFNVAFADGHVEAIKDEAAFKKMLAKAQGK